MFAETIRGIPNQNQNPRREPCWKETRSSSSVLPRVSGIYTFPPHIHIPRIHTHTQTHATSVFRWASRRLSTQHTHTHTLTHLPELPSLKHSSPGQYPRNRCFDVRPTPEYEHAILAPSASLHPATLTFPSHVVHSSLLCLTCLPLMLSARFLLPPNSAHETRATRPSSEESSIREQLGQGEKRKRKKRKKGGEKTSDDGRVFPCCCSLARPFAPTPTSSGPRIVHRRRPAKECRRREILYSFCIPRHASNLHKMKKKEKIGQVELVEVDGCDMLVRDLEIHEADNKHTIPNAGQASRPGGQPRTNEELSKGRRGHAGDMS